MKRVKSGVQWARSIVVGATLSVLASTWASAGVFNLVDNGDFSTDTSTGLDWLDLSFTEGLNYQDVLVNYLTLGNSLHGWRFATVDEAFEMYSSMGPFLDGDSTDNFSGTLIFFNMFGFSEIYYGDPDNNNGYTNAGFSHYQFYFGDPDVLPSDKARYAYVSLENTAFGSPEDSAYLEDDTFIGELHLVDRDNIPSTALASLLVRDSSDLPFCNDRETPPTGAGIPPRCRPPGLDGPPPITLILFGLFGVWCLTRHSASIVFGRSLAGLGVTRQKRPHSQQDGEQLS